MKTVILENDSFEAKEIFNDAKSTKSFDRMAKKRNPVKSVSQTVLKGGGFQPSATINFDENLL